MKPKLFTVITNRGRAKTYDQVSYFSVLTAIYDEFRSGGSNHDLANMLLLNGKVVVTSGLNELAYKYCTERDEAMQKARDEVQRMFDQGFDNE